jgi:hypothetical protein
VSDKFLSFEVLVKGEFDAFKIEELITAADLEAAAASGLALLKERVQHGRRADGARFKPYSRDPIYVPLKGLGTGNPAVKPHGGRLTKGVDGKPPKTMYFEQGYAEFRDKAGRGSDPVNFTLSGNVTGKRFRVIKKTKTAAIVGWPAGSTQALAAAGLDAREDGLAFSWSPTEQEDIVECIEAAIAANLKKAGVAITPEEVALIAAKGRKV